MTERKKRCYEIDVLYTIGILLVIIGHSHSSDWGRFQGTILVPIIDVIYAFHMPLFFFMAGFLFWNSNKLYDVGFGKWIKEKAIKLLTPYVIVTILGGIPKYYAEKGTLLGVERAIVNSIIIPRMNLWGHFWFIVILFEMYALFGLIGMISKNTSVRFALLFGVASLCWILPLDTMYFGIEDISKYAIYFAIGAGFRLFCLGKRTQVFREIIMFLSLIVVYIFKNYCENTGRIYQLCCAMFLIIANWELAFLIKKNKVATWISKHSFTIYIYSWPFQSVMMLVCDYIGMIWYLETIAMFLIGVLGPIFIIMIYDKLYCVHCKILDLIVGVK